MSASSSFAGGDIHDDTGSATRKGTRLPDVALLIAVAPLVAAGIRIWLFADGDATVFLTLLRTLNVPAVLVGTFVLLVPSVLIYAILILLTDWRARDLVRSWNVQRHPWLGPLVFVAGLLIVFTVPWSFFVGLGLIGVLVAMYFITEKYWPWGRRHITHVLVARRGDRSGPDSIVTIALLVLLAGTAPTYMWLPMERIGIADKPSLTGYVLESTENWTTVLTASRILEILPTEAIEKREMCRSQSAASIASLIYARGDGQPLDCG